MLKTKKLNRLFKLYPSSVVETYIDMCIDRTNASDALRYYLNTDDVGVADSALKFRVPTSVLEESISSLKFYMSLCENGGSRLLPLSRKVLNLLYKNDLTSYDKVKEVLEECNGVFPKYTGLGEASFAEIYDLFGLKTISDFKPVYIKDGMSYLDKRYVRHTSKECGYLYLHHDALASAVKFLYSRKRGFQLEDKNGQQIDFAKQKFI